MTHININNKLKLDRSSVLGEGGFGVVCEGSWVNQNGVEIKVAVKRLELLKLKKSDRHEEENLKKLNHANVVKLFDVQDDRDFRY